MTYVFFFGGLFGQDVMPDGKVVFITVYAFIFANTMRDIVTSYLFGWFGTCVWIIAWLLLGFVETFVQYAVEVALGGGSDTPEPDSGAQVALLVVSGQMWLTIDGVSYDLWVGGYVYIFAGSTWSLTNPGNTQLQFYWVRKCYEFALGVDAPAAFVMVDQDMLVNWMPDIDKWGTTRFVDFIDLRHDMHVNIVTF